MKIMKNFKSKKFNKHKFLKFDLSKYVFTSSKFNQCNFWESNLTNTRFINSIINDSVFSDAKLNNSKFLSRPKRTNELLGILLSFKIILYFLIVN